MENNKEPPGLDFYVHGTPKGKGRPRFSTDFWGGVHTHTPAATAAFEQRVRDYYLETYPRLIRPVYGKDVPLILEVEAFFSPPESLSKKKKLQLLEHGGAWVTKRPDLDNIVKAVSDAMNNVAYHDDAQLVKVISSKRYAAIEGVRVQIYPA